MEDFAQRPGTICGSSASRDMLDRSNPAEYPLPRTSAWVPRLTCDGHLDQREVAEECAVALVYDGTTAAVLMATPADLPDLAIGFSLTEGIIQSASEIEGLEVVPGRDGIELRMWLTPNRGRQFRKRQRLLTGPTGCGLCGVESLTEAVRPSPRVRRAVILSPSEIEQAVAALASAQSLNQKTRATHAAGFYSPREGFVAAREDVGRHNALDKLAGGLAIQNVPGGTGAIILTSRVSVEMVQKTAVIGSPILVAISAPTALAVKTAETCGITLVGIARGPAFEIFTHPDGINREGDQRIENGFNRGIASDAVGQLPTSTRDKHR